MVTSVVKCCLCFILLWCYLRRHASRRGSLLTERCNEAYVWSKVECSQEGDSDRDIAGCVILCSSSVVFFLGLRLRRRKGKAESGGEKEEQNLNHTHMETHINMSVRCYAFDVSTLSSKGGCFSSPFSTHHPTSPITCLHAWCRNLFPTQCSSDFTSVWDSASVPSLQKLLAFEALSLCRINSSFVSLRDHTRTCRRESLPVPQNVLCRGQHTALLCWHRS